MIFCGLYGVLLRLSVRKIEDYAVAVDFKATREGLAALGNKAA